MAERRLIQACKYGDVEELRELLAEGVDVNSGVLVTAFYEAFENKVVHADRDLQERADAAIALLLENGADPNPSLDHDEGMLHCAAMFAETQTVRRLLDAGADPNVMVTCPLRGGTPLHQLCHMQVRRRDHYAGLRKEIATCARLLIQAGARVNERAADGRTPLSMVFYNHSRYPPVPDELIKILLRAGAQIVESRAAAEIVESHRLRQRELCRRARPPPPYRAIDLIAAIEKVGGWNEYVLEHRRVVVGLVTKCVPLSNDDAAAHVAGFLWPEGGY